MTGPVEPVRTFIWLPERQGSLQDSMVDLKADLYNDVVLLIVAIIIYSEDRDHVGVVLCCNVVTNRRDQLRLDRVVTSFVDSWRRGEFGASGTSFLPMGKCHRRKSIAGGGII